MRPDIVNRDKASSHPLKSGRFYMGIVKSVDSRGAATIHVSELGSSYDKVVPLNTTNLNRVAVGDVVKCTFSDEFFTELIVLGVSNIKEVPEVSSFSPVISSPIPGQVIQYNGTSWVNASAGAGEPEFKVGDTGPAGGTIFYDKGGVSSGWQYLEIAPPTWDPAYESSGNTEQVFQWINGYFANIANARYSTIGSGTNNSSEIKIYADSQGTTCLATSRCLDLSFGGESDWFLPSLYEMMTAVRSGVIEFSFVPGGTNYWTSTQSTSNSLAFHVDNFGNISTSHKGTSYYVRPIRRF